MSRPDRLGVDSLRLSTDCCSAGQSWFSSGGSTRVEREFESTFDGKLAQLTGPLRTWAAHDLTTVPV